MDNLDADGKGVNVDRMTTLASKIALPQTPFQSVLLSGKNGVGTKTTSPGTDTTKSESYKLLMETVSKLKAHVGAEIKESTIIFGDRSPDGSATKSKSDKINAGLADPKVIQPPDNWSNSTGSRERVLIDAGLSSYEDAKTNDDLDLGSANWSTSVDTTDDLATLKSELNAARQKIRIQERHLAEQRERLARAEDMDTSILKINQSYVDLDDSDPPSLTPSENFPIGAPPDFVARNANTVPWQPAPIRPANIWGNPLLPPPPPVALDRNMMRSIWNPVNESALRFGDRGQALAPIGPFPMIFQDRERTVNNMEHMRVEPKHDGPLSAQVWNSPFDGRVPEFPPPDYNNGWNARPFETTRVSITPPMATTNTGMSPNAAEFWLPSNLPGEMNEEVEIVHIDPNRPVNYQKLLGRSVICEWKNIIDKIVIHNDQQASLFLQQKLKTSYGEQKSQIVDAIIAQAYPLMINRFGNFLVQRCFEHGTPDQIKAIANIIRGKTLNLSMHSFGCHVVQKAFDVVPEECKAVMVHELLRRIPETITHRHACHVWQKLFELRWSDAPPQIMSHVNAALRGCWHQVALGETGSLVVQNVFENCMEEDKRQCIEEVLQNIDEIAHGQFGNWCIQHICEHGEPADKKRAIDHVILYAAEYSMDQFASKVVEKCLKLGDNDFLDRYLARICESQPDRPRSPLVDVACDQYGNYLIQYILAYASARHREVVAAQVRKHLVSIRGSKFGNRVGLMCSDPSIATRPGPAMVVPPSRAFQTVGAGRFGNRGF